MTLSVDNVGITASTGIANVALTGWSNTLRAKTQGGKLYWALVGTTLTFYRDAARTLGVASGTVASGAATLAALNTSGITGSCDVSASDGATGRVLISYCEESDLAMVLHSYAGYATTNNWNGGGVRFEAAFLQAKRELDDHLRGRYPHCDIIDIAAPLALSRIHALLTAAHIEEREASIDTAHIELAAMHRKNAMAAIGVVQVAFDVLDDSLVDYESSGASRRVTR